MPRFICLLSLLSVAGCAGTQKVDVGSADRIAFATPVGSQPADPKATGRQATGRRATGRQAANGRPVGSQSNTDLQSLARSVSFRLANHTPSEPVAFDYADDIASGEEMDSGLTEQYTDTIEELPAPENVPSLDDTLQLNLPTVLSMVGGQHPAVGLAQWRVQQAYAELDQAKALWLPSIRAGFSFHRHDGNYQASNGDIVDVNRNSFQYGLGVGATGAGTTPLPGVVARFHMADAIFRPKVARNTASAQTHAAAAVVNEQLMSAAIAYLSLLDAHQDARIVVETRDSTTDLFKLTSDFAVAGKGLQADADRMGTELALVENRVVAAREQIEVAEAQLVQAISARAGAAVLPLDPVVLPIELVSLQTDKSSLIGTGLANRPELKESQALVAAACREHQRQKFAPFVPSVLLGFSTNGFGGGLGNNLDNVNDRYDFDALMSWELRNLGVGERAARRDANARVQQAKFAKIQVMDQVAREVAEAHAQVRNRSERITITQRAIQMAEDSYQRNLSRIRDGQGLPLEALQSLQALEDARRAYLRAVVEHNQAQFRLQWSLGWPVTAPSVQ